VNVEADEASQTPESQTPESQTPESPTPEPQATYARARAGPEPVTLYEGPMGPMALVWRRQEVELALKSPEIYSSVGSIDLQNERPLIPLNVDPPAHRRYRQILDPWFSRGALRPLADQIRTITAEHLKLLEGRQEAEMVAEFCVPVPSRVFARLLGVPDADLRRLLELKDGIIRPHQLAGVGVGRPEAQALQRRAAAEIYQYFEHALRTARPEPEAGLLGRLAASSAEPGGLSPTELLDVGFLLIVAGLDTVSSSLECMFSFLASHPQDRQSLVEDPTLVPTAVEELLRYESPVMAVPRRVAAPSDLGGCRLEAGRTAILMLGSANTDPAGVADADQVRLGRKPNRHLAFGAGPHRCLGAALARLELRLILEQWHERFPRYRLADPDAVHSGGLASGIGVRTLDELRLVLGS